MVERAAVVLVLAVTVDSYIATWFSRLCTGIGEYRRLGCVWLLLRLCAGCSCRSVGNARLGASARRWSRGRCYDGNRRAAR